jgi:hypothetical protein
VTQALAQFVLDHDGTIIARWDTFKGEVVYEQHRSAGVDAARVEPATNASAERPT